MTPSRRPIFTLKAVMAALALLLAVFITLPASGGNSSPRVIPGNVRIPVLMYHHLDDQWDHAPGVVIPPQRFEEHLQSLREAGYQGITFRDLLKAAEGRKVLPAKPVILTFDDGYLSNYTVAFPLLKKYGFRATINVVGSSRGITPGGIPHFSWEQAREMASSGLVEIGDHSWDMHGYGMVRQVGETRESLNQRIRRDLAISRPAIGRHVGEVPLVFCYPFGKNDSVTRKAVKESGYIYQLTTVRGILTGATDPTAIPRITVRGDMTGAKLLELLEDADC